jgi:hypothetical protein
MITTCSKSGQPTPGHGLADTEGFSRLSSRLLIKPSMAFSTSPLEKRGFPMVYIFNGLQPLKMATRPYAARNLRKNCVFQQAASSGSAPA